MEEKVIVRVRGCKRNHKESIPKKSTQKFAEVEALEGRGREEEGVE